MVMRHIIIILAILCASCSSYAIKPYKMDIQQGNVVTSKMMLQLRPGMTKSQVRFIMGTPLIQDSFHKDRWDYFYQFRKDGKIIEQRNVVLDFENEQLAHVRGDVVPAGSDQEQAAPSSESKAGKVIVLPPTPVKKEKGLLDKLKFWKSDEEPAGQPQAAPAELVTPKDNQPAPAKQQSPAKAVPAPVAPAPKPEPAPEPEQTKPEPAPAVEPKPEVTPAPEPAPEPIAAPVPAPAPEEPAKPAEPAKVEQPATEQPSAKVKTPAAKPVAKPVPEPEKELPPEDEPGYFERMLEKIGF